MFQHVIATKKQIKTFFHVAIKQQACGIIYAVNYMTLFFTHAALGNIGTSKGSLGLLASVVKKYFIFMVDGETSS